jgi:hypothetical protein
MEKATDYTLILNYFNKGAEHLNSQLDRVFEQNLLPKYIIGCFLGCPKEHSDLINAFLDRTKDLDNVYTVYSDFNFKYIGRYQIALGSPTEKIIMLDDDRFPMPDYCRAMVSIIHREDCIVQNNGWVLNKTAGKYCRHPLEHSYKKIENDKEEYAYEGIADQYGKYYRINDERSKNGPKLIEADYLCGGMSFRKSSLKHLFNEDFTTKTGEDIMFCIRAKKNGIPVYIYRPEDSHAGDMRSLEHNQGGVQGTVGDIDAWEFRTELLHKELGYPFGKDFKKNLSDLM